MVGPVRPAALIERLGGKDFLDCEIGASHLQFVTRTAPTAASAFFAVQNVAESAGRQRFAWSLDRPQE